jgi:hypothetical protein
VLQIVRWENDAFPAYGGDAQSLINAQIAEMRKYALFVGIMWNRLGTPTPRAESGTVEEFARAVESFTQIGQPDIWFYFRQAASHLDSEDQLEQRKKVLAFRKLVQTNGLPWTYTTPVDFREKFRSQITLWLNARAQKASGKDVTTKEGARQIDNNKGNPIRPPQHEIPGSRDLLRQCRKLFESLDEFRNPESLRAFFRTRGLYIYERCIARSAGLDFDLLLDCLKRSGRDYEGQALVELLKLLASNYSDDHRGQQCQEMKNNLERQFTGN